MKANKEWAVTTEEAVGDSAFYDVYMADADSCPLF